MYNKKLPPSIEPYMILLNINPNLNWNRFNVWRWLGVMEERNIFVLNTKGGIFGNEFHQYT